MKHLLIFLLFFIPILGQGQILAPPPPDALPNQASANTNAQPKAVGNAVDNALIQLEYAKIADEGFRTRDAVEIIDKSTFLDCEPVWRYFSFSQVAGGGYVEGKEEWTFPNGQTTTSTFSDGPAPPNGWTWLRYSRHYDFLAVGTHTWKLYQKISGSYVLVSTRTINVVSGPAGLACAEKMHLPMNGNTNDVSGAGNNAISQGGSISYDKDRFNNCNGAIRINSGRYLEAPVINERAVSLWFKLNQQEQMVIYDGGPNGIESKEYKIGVYKPGGLWGNASFDNTYGIFFNTWDRDMAVPFDAVKSGWHHVVVSRVQDGFERFRIMIDGQFPDGYVWDGYVTVQQWTAQAQPFALPSGGYGVPNLFAPTFKTYLGRDVEINTEFFDGWLDEVRVFGQLLDPSEMATLYNAADDNPNNITISSGQTTYCEGQTIQLFASANNAVSYAWSGPGNFSSSQQNPTRSNVTAPMAGSYTVTISFGGGCTNTRAVTVNINTPPALSFSTASACAGQANGGVTATATGSAPFTFLWSTGQTSASINNLSTGTYTVTVTGGNGCTRSSTATVGTAPAPSAVTSSTATCIGVSTGTATVTATGGVSPYSYKWSNNQIGATATGLAAGTYTVTITGNNGCNGTATATVGTLPATVAEFSSTATAQTVNFLNSSANATTYTWTFGDGNAATQTSPAHTYSAPGVYEVCLTATGICGSATICNTVTIAPPGWDFQPCSSGIAHSVAVLDDAITNIAGQSLDAGDLVGFFFNNPAGGNVCSNFGTWQNATLSLDVCGDNPTTLNQKEGYAFGENFLIRVWKNGAENSVVACYVPKDAFGLNNPSHTGSFAANGLSYIECLKTPAAPGTDLDCSNPIPITCGETKTGNTVNGTAGASTYNCFPNLVDGAEVVYQFTNPTQQNVLITLTGLQQDLELVLLDACDRNQCSHYSDRTGTSPEAIYVPNLAAGTYFIVVEGYLGSESAYTLKVQCNNSISNGALDCASAGPIQCGQTQNGNTASGTDQIIQYGCSPAYTSGKEKVYSFSSSSNKFAFVRLDNLSSDLDLIVLDPCDPNNCVVSSNKSGTEKEAAVFYAPAGKLFFIVVDGYFDAESAFSLTVGCADPCSDPADCPYEIGGAGNQQIINAQVVQCGVPVSGNNTSGQANASFYSCPSSYSSGREVVYRFENQSMQDISIILSGMSANLDLYLLSGPSIFNCLVSSHKSGNSDEGVVVQALPAGTYYIVVDGYDGALSGYSLLVQCSSSALTCQTIDLVAGTNFVSSNIEPLDPAIDALFPPSGQSPIISIENQFNQSYSPNAQSNPADFGEWDFRKAYRIKALAPVSIQVCGEKADPDTPIQFMAQTAQGVAVNNWISFLKDQAFFVKDSFTPALTPEVFRVWNMPTNANGTLTPQSYLVSVQSGVNFEMKPGSGYVLNVSADGAYTYGLFGGHNDDRAAAISQPATVENGCRNFTMPIRNTMNTATVIVPKSIADSAKLLPGDEIGVFNATGLLCGSARFDGFSISMVISGDNAESAQEIEGFLTDEPLHFRCWRKTQAEIFDMVVQFESGLPIFKSDAVYWIKGMSLLQISPAANVKPEISWSVYPNPFSTRTTIGMYLPVAMDASIDLLSSDGHFAKAVHHGLLSEGYKNIDVVLPGALPGVYFLKLTTDHQVMVQKIIVY